MKKILKKSAIIMLSGSLVFTPITFLSDECSIISEAHSGRTDSSGGHKDNKNASGLGSYHYHCGGNPAHLHDGGVCPYSTSSSSASSISANSTSSDSAEGQNGSITSGSNSIILSDDTTVNLSKDMIKILQDVLTEKGYDCGNIDGIAGSKTTESIKKYLDEEDESSTDHIIISMIAEALGL